MTYHMYMPLYIQYLFDRNISSLWCIVPSLNAISHRILLWSFACNKGRDQWWSSWSGLMAYPCSEFSRSYNTVTLLQFSFHHLSTRFLSFIKVWNLNICISSVSRAAKAFLQYINHTFQHCLSFLCHLKRPSKWPD